MRHCVHRFLLIVFAFAVLTDISAQDKKSQTLLWRIHKGNEKPSFLFGTMHISDKKAFNFRDSLYTYLGQADAFALELNPDSANQIVAAYMNGELSWDNSNSFESSFSGFEPDTLINIKTSDKNEIKTKALKEDKRGLIDYFVNRLINNKKKEAQSMNTFMDAFLYEMAWQQGKKMFGLEELEGQAEVTKALSQGLKAKKVKNLFDKWDPLKEESPIHRLYLNEDIDSIDLFYNEFFNESALEIFLYDRNKVMADRMDSIMRGQSLFAAVGAAHLAGEKGVIAMLRKKGYLVEPVFSKNRISADGYQFKNNKRSWQSIKNEEYGFQYRLPGLAKSQEGARGRKIVYHYDIGGGSVFMTICGKLSASEKKKSTNDIVTGHLDEMLTSAGGRTLSKKALVHDGMKMMEAVCLYNDNSYYRYREIVKDNLFYILSVGSEKRDNLNTEKAEEYFNSFKSIPIPLTNWSTFAAPAEGFSISFPGKPGVENIPVDKESAGSIAMKTYSYFDAAYGINYSVTPGKTLADNQFMQGEYFFQNYIEYIRQLSGEEPLITDTSMNGYPGKLFRTLSTDNQVKGFIVRRANTSYYVIAEYEPGNKANAEADRFLESFHMTAFDQPAWSLQQSPGNDFTSWLPSSIQQKKQDSTAYNFKAGEIQYYGHDQFASTNYYVEVYPISKYYWSPHPDSIYNHWKNKMMSWSDTLLKSSIVRNGGIEGREVWLMDKTSKDKRVLRLLLNGNSMYVLTTALPFIFPDEKNINRFLGEFKLNKEESAAAILGNDSQQLFIDLQSKDSAIFQGAYDALNDVQFLERDIMLLMEKATIQYPVYENNYQSVNDKLLLQVEQLLKNNESRANRNKVADFIRDVYSKQDKVIDSTRFSLLGMIAAAKDIESYQLVKELLATKKLAADYNYRLFGKLYDSLELTKTLYPELLNYVTDSTMGLAIVSLTKTMIDSNQLTSDILLPVKPELIKLAKKQAKEMNKDDHYPSYAGPDLIELLGYLKQKDADDIIAGFLKAKYIWIKKSATLALIKNNRPVASPVLLAIAKDQQYRVDLYTELRKLKKENLFPGDYRSQIGLAEGYIFNAVYDEEEDASRPELIFIKKVEYVYKGAKKIFYIFRAKYEYESTEDPGDDEDNEENDAAVTTESYFTVAGPFDPDNSKLAIDEKENISGMWYDDKFDGMKNDYFFRKYIEQSLKWQNEKNK